MRTRPAEERRLGDLVCGVLVLAWVGASACDLPDSRDGAGAEAGTSPEAESASPVGEAAAQAAEARARMEENEGGRLVLRAIEAHGGLERWYSTPTSSFGWEYSSAGSGYRFKTEMVAHNRSREVYHDVVALGTPDDPRPFDGRMAWNGKEAWFVPAEVDRINARFWATTGHYFEMIPFVFADPGVRYERLPDQELDGEAYHMAKVSFDPGVGDASDYYVTYVDQETGLIHAIRYVVTFGRRAPGEETLFYYEDYVTVDGLTVPTRFRGYLFSNGEKRAFKNEAWATDVKFGVPFDSARMERPDSARVDPLPGG